MLGLFEPSYRRSKDERDIRYFYSQYGADTPDVLQERANDNSLTTRDRRHWQRLAHKARRKRSERVGEVSSG